MQLDELRAQIDQIDEELLRLFEKRMQIATQVAAYKKARGLPVLDRKREIEKLEPLAKKVSPELGSYAQDLYETLFALSRRYQEKQGVEESRCADADS